MKRADLTRELTGLRRASIGGRRAPHKPLLVLWLLGRFAASGGAPGGTAVTYDEAEEPVSRLINDFGPAVTSPARARERAAMPFVHLERSLWDLRDAAGHPIGPDAPERGGPLRARGAHGRLRPEAEALLADPAVLAGAARQLLEQHFTPALEALVCDAAGLDLPGLDEEAYAAVPPPVRPARRARRAGFAEEVLHAYAYACAFCGFDGALGRHPVGLEAAHVRWHSQDGPDAVENGLALCSLHHTLFDLGVLGLLPGTRPGAPPGSPPGPRIQVSRLYVTRSEAGRAVDALHGSPVAPPRPGHPPVSTEFVIWHGRQVFKRPGAAVA
ncbi:phosphorothioated DNA-binding restriction endonuclease [Streptomyces sp. NPDC093109]|uniref:phosphorothioated DNA-binding restriction endonuclease n=1 Tax=Streptomyces sp. NPDC093109 TaxID=3154977 RepID=UPI00344FCFAA